MRMKEWVWIWGKDVNVKEDDGLSVDKEWDIDVDAKDYVEVYQVEDEAEDDVLWRAMR